jgi:hypothetical protein
MSSESRPRTGTGGEAWEAPQLREVGHVTEVLQQGLGKLSPPFDDPGEPRKPKGQEDD